MWRKMQPADTKLDTQGKLNSVKTLFIMSIPYKSAHLGLHNLSLMSSLMIKRNRLTFWEIICYSNEELKPKTYRIRSATGTLFSHWAKNHHLHFKNNSCWTQLNLRTQLRRLSWRNQNLRNFWNTQQFSINPRRPEIYATLTGWEAPSFSVLHLQESVQTQATCYCLGIKAEGYTKVSVQNKHLLFIIAIDDHGQQKKRLSKLGRLTYFDV